MASKADHLPPDLLYKYMSFEGFARLVNTLRVSFTSPIALNDLYEGTFDVTRMVEHQMDLSYEKTVKGMVSDPANPLAQYSEESLRYAMWSDRKFRDLVEFTTKRDAWQVQRAKLRDFGVLSLTEANDNIPMWSHYADNARGIAVGLASDARFMSSSRCYGIEGLQKVEYVEKKGAFEGSKISERLKQGFLRKGLEWRYEREWRCFKEIGNGKERVLAELDARDIREIIIGPSMSLKDIERVYAAHLKVASHARLAVAVPHPSLYVMEIIDAPVLEDLRRAWEISFPITPLPKGRPPRAIRGRDRKRGVT